MAEDKPNLESETSAAANEKTSGKEREEQTGSIKDTINKAKETAGHAAAQVAGKAQEKAVELIDGQKINLAAGITMIAESVRHIGEDLQKRSGEENQAAAFAGQYGDSLAGQIERLSHYVEDKDFREIARDAEQLARRNPTLFVGGAFALGILAARIFKSSGRNGGKRQLKSSVKETPAENAAVQAS